MKVFFIRHGESLANLNLTSSLFSNDNNNKITELGKQQIRKTQEVIGQEIDAVYSSPMYRTIESANEFLRGLRHETLFTVDDRLREVDYGIYTDDRDNPEMSKIAERQIAGDYEIRFGGGENKREIITRFFSFLINCFDNHMNENIVVFSHGRAISMIESEFCKINNIEKRHIHTDNGTIKELDINKEAAMRMREHIDYLNQGEIQKRDSLLVNKELEESTRASLKEIIDENIDDVDASYEVLSKFVNGLTTHNLEKIYSSGNHTNTKNGVILTTVLRDSESFVNNFIDHYEKIGVRDFVFIDNASRDLTLVKIRELAEQKTGLNIDIWEIEDKFDAIKAMGWKQKIMETCGFQRWYLNLDIDELLLIEQKTIQELIEELEKSNVESLGGILIEQYPKESIKDIEMMKYDEIMEKYKYFDKDGYFEMPNQKYQKRIFGGMRMRLFGIAPSLQKIPLILFKPGVISINPHFWYPYSINLKTRFQCPILHYKFLPNDRLKCVEYIQTGVHYNNSSEYKAYYNVIKDNQCTFYDEKVSKERKTNDKTLDDLDIRINSILDKEPTIKADVFTELIIQYLEKYARDLDSQNKNEIVKTARKEIIKNIDNRIASMLPESKVAQLLVLLEEGSPSDSEVSSFIEQSGVASLEEIVKQECQKFFN